MAGHLQRLGNWRGSTFAQPPGLYAFQTFYKNSKRSGPICSFHPRGGGNGGGPARWDALAHKKCLVAAKLAHLHWLGQTPRRIRI